MIGLQANRLLMLLKNKMISPDDPSAWLCNEVSDQIKNGIPHNENQLFHHPAHARIVARKARKAGIENHLIITDKDKSSEFTLEIFMEKHLLQ